MSIYSISDLRAQAPEDLRSLDDVGLIRAFSERTGKDPMQVAEYLGYRQKQGMGSARVSAGVDNYQAGLLGVGEAVAGELGVPGVAQYFGQRRQANELDAQIAQRRAQQLGAVDDWRDVDGVGSGLNYLGGLGAQSLPYLGEAVVGGLTGGMALTGTVARLGLQGARAANAARTVGAVAASYPSAVGDILQNQRDENGTTDLGSAAVGGVPYAALNALGIEGLAARGLRPLAQFDGNMLARMGKQGAVTSLSEGAAETGQEMVNQYFGRMAVNTDETLFNEDANKRYVDSFVGGAALGGVVGPLGGIRRDEQPKPPVEEQPDLLDRARPEFQLSSYGQDEGPQFGTELQQDGKPSTPYNDPRQMNLMSGVNEMVNGIPVELTQDELTGNQLPFMPPDMTPQFELGNGAQQSYQGGFDFEPVGVNAPTLGLQPGRMSGAQLDMFGGPDTFGEAAPSQTQRQAPEYQDTQTRDMLMETPSAMVPTMFNPAQDTAVGQPNVATTRSMGAVAANIRSQMAHRLGSADAYTTKLSFGLAQNLNSVETAVAWLDTQSAALDKEQANLDKQADRDIIDPNEYATKREQVENKRIALMAAEELVGQMRKARQDALVQEAMGKARPGAVVGQAPTNDVAVQQQVEKNQQVQMDSALETTDAKVAEGMRRQTGNERADILGSVLDTNPPAGQVLMRFNQALRGAGFTKLANAEEVSTLKAYLNTVKVAEPEVEPSAPNEMDVYEQPKAKAAPAQPKPPVQPTPAPSGRAAPEPAAAAKTTSTPAPAPVAAKPAPAPAPVASAAKPDAVAPAKASGSKPVSVLKSDGEQAVVDLRKRLSVLQQLKACLAS